MTYGAGHILRFELRRSRKEPATLKLPGEVPLETIYKFVTRKESANGGNVAEATTLFDEGGDDAPPSLQLLNRLDKKARSACILRASGSHSLTHPRPADAEEDRPRLGTQRPDPSGAVVGTADPGLVTPSVCCDSARSPTHAPPSRFEGQGASSTKAALGLLRHTPALSPG